jgi:hypothetical protein
LLVAEAEAGALVRRSEAAGADFEAYRELVKLVDRGHGYAALLEAEKVRRSLDGLTRLAVDEARRKGATWVQIGAALGLSKQGAQQRYGR